MKKLALSLLLGAVLPFVAGTIATAQTIFSLNFQGSDATAMAAGDTTGVFSADNWTNVTGGSGGPLALQDSTGSTAAGVTLTSFGAGYISGPGTSIGDNSTPQETLFGGAVSSNSSFGSGPMTFTLNGLSGFSSYDIVVYYSAGTSFPDARDITATASGSALTYYGTGMNNDGSGTTTTYQPATSTTSGTFTQGNYVEWTGLTGGSQTVSLTTSDYMDINGFQISGTVPAVPEPSTWALMFGGLGLLIGVQKLRSRSSKI